MDEPRECHRVKSEAFHVDYHDFLNSHVANFREHQQFAGKNYTIMWQLLLHLGFLVSAIALAYTDKILYSTSHKTH